MRLIPLINPHYKANGSLVPIHDADVNRLTARTRHMCSASTYTIRTYVHGAGDSSSILNTWTVVRMLNVSHHTPCSASEVARPSGSDTHEIDRRTRDTGLLHVSLTYNTAMLTKQCSPTRPGVCLINHHRSVVSPRRLEHQAPQAWIRGHA